MFDVNTDKLLQTENGKWQTRPLVREGAPQRKDSKFRKPTFGQKVISCHESQSGLDTLTYWLAVSCNVTSTSRHRGRPIETRQQISENNLRTERNIWSQVPEWARYLDILTDWSTAVTWLRFLVREDAPQRQDSKFRKTTFGRKVISGHESQSGLDTLTYWLTDRQL
jgi:hypothetical protein